MVKTVIVTLSFYYSNGERSYDMEIPCNVPAKTLIVHICRTLRGYTNGKIDLISSELRLYCRRLGHYFEPHETFEQLGIWNGDHIDMK